MAMHRPPERDRRKPLRLSLPAELIEVAREMAMNDSRSLSSFIESLVRKERARVRTQIEIPALR